MATTEQYLTELRRQPTWSIFRSWRPRYTNENGGVSCTWRPMSLRRHPIIVNRDLAKWLETKIDKNDRMKCKDHQGCTPIYTQGNGIQHYWLDVIFDYHNGAQKRDC